MNLTQLDSKNHFKESQFPTITVLVTAHRTRKNYIKRALHSVSNQDKVLSHYETIVVKDFEDPEIDEYIHQIGARNVILKESTIGEMLAKGIEEAKGDIICFLDDDDTFVSNKLKMVQKEFFSNPSLVYFHNSYRKIDERQKVALNPLYKSNGFKRDFYGSFSSQYDLLFVLKMNCLTNLSSVSVRRASLIDYVKDISKITGATDYMIFYIARLSNRNFAIGKEILTNYYVHNSAMHLKSPVRLFFKRMYGLSIDQITTHKYGFSKEPIPAVKKVIFGLLSQWEFLKDITLATDRKNAIRHYNGIFQGLFQIRNNYVILFSILAFLYILNPLLPIQLIRVFQ